MPAGKYVLRCVMESTWINLNATYYVAKIFGFLPFAGNNRCISFLYSLFMWTFLSLSGICMVAYNLKKSQNVKSRYNMIMKVIFIEAFIKFIVAISSTIISAQRSRGFFALEEKFWKFDKFKLQIKCPSNVRTQTFYLLHVLFIGIYNFVSAFSYINVVFYILLPWNMFCITTMLIIIQYVTYVRMLRERYKMANVIFENSMKNRSSGARYMYAKEINNLFIELRGLTEEVKEYYAYHAILIIIESVLILVTSVTTLAINYLNDLDTTFIHNGYYMGHCSLRILFLYYVTKNTVFIGHKALSIISDATTVKHLEVLILNCWNHPVVFDVHDFFDLDYHLLQSIVASVVTYVVVLVQIQLAIIQQ